MKFALWEYMMYAVARPSHRKEDRTSMSQRLTAGGMRVVIEKSNAKTSDKRSDHALLFLSFVLGVFIHINARY